MTSSILHSAEPVFRVDGAEKGELARDLLRLDVEETTEGLKTAVLRLAGNGPSGDTTAQRQVFLDGSIVDFGKSLEVSIGPPDGARTVFKGKVSAIEAAFGEGRDPEVVVFAEDELMELRMTRRMKSYEKMSDADIASAIASQHGLSPSVSAEGPTYDVVQQWNQSDLAFLRERARPLAAEVWVADGTLHFSARGSRSGTEVTLAAGGELIEVQLRADLAHQRTKVKVSGYDARARDRIDEEAAGDAVQGEVSGGRTGPDVLQQAFGERVSYRVMDAPLETGEATAFARAEMLRRARAFVVATGMTSGTPDLTVGSKLTLDGVGAPFNGGGYYVTRVHHSYDRTSGHRTRFAAERATVNAGGGG
ncbi:MAG TPA: contractile injection system protein, VgrG/Pvc8 family [Longimicrobiaceae bacterium]|nr:contractile injection system protein, VgrG/Pvc8 family [Longimicrobiaceae bacterium]